jgi:formate-dependent nitrite reductase cytochrome c552 subunit
LTAKIAKNTKRENKKDGDLNREICQIRENWSEGEISHEDAKTRREKWESEFRQDLPDQINFWRSVEKAAEYRHSPNASRDRVVVSVMTAWGQSFSPWSEN